MRRQAKFLYGVGLTLTKQAGRGDEEQGFAHILDDPGKLGELREKYRPNQHGSHGSTESLLGNPEYGAHGQSTWLR